MPTYANERSALFPGKPNELQGEDILPVFSAIASRRDLVDKEQAEQARFEKSPGELERAEKYRFENHRKLANMEKVVAGLQTVIAYFEEARLRREQEMTKNERTYRIKERLKAEEANVRIYVSHVLLLAPYTRILMTSSLL